MIIENVRHVLRMVGDEFHYLSKCQNPSVVKVRKESPDLTQIINRDTIMDMMFKI